MAESHPLVSIGMPVYNGERYIRRALDSLLAQDYPNLELIILDNASTDRTGEICSEYAARDRRIRYRVNPGTIPVVENFNRVLGYATGKYYMWAAHDDLWEPSYVSRLAGALEEDERSVLAFSDFDNLDEMDQHHPGTGIEWGRVFARGRFWRYASMALLDETSQKANWIYGLMRREALLACGGMELHPIGNSGEDIVTLLRLLARGDFIATGQVLFHYRIRPLPTRGGRPLLPYLWGRIFKRVPGHRGNLINLLRRNHQFHSSVRRVIRTDTPLHPTEKAVLCLAVALKELWSPLRVVPAAAIRQLRPR